MHEIRACLLYDSLNIKGDVSRLEPDHLVGLSNCFAQATRVFAPAHGVRTQLDHGDNLVLTHPSAKTDGRPSSGPDGSGYGFDVYWSVAAPGQVDLPTVTIDGVDVTRTLIDDHLSGLNSFTAAASEWTDEFIEPIPCEIGVFVPEGNTLGPPA